MDSNLSTVMRARAYRETLQAEGFPALPPEWDAEARTWDIRVKYEGASLLIVLDADDRAFVRIMLPNFWSLSTPDMPATMETMEKVNKACKCAKLFLNARGDNIHASTEFLDAGEHPDGPCLVRYLAMTVNAARRFAHAFQPTPMPACSDDGGRKTVEGNGTDPESIRH